MRHLKSGRKFSRRSAHRKAMLANLAVSLIEHGSIRTTDAKAKEIRPIVEKLVTFARRGDLHARRIVLSRLKNTAAVKKLFDELGPRYVDRPGGYTRILKLGFRHGDNSPISLIEFVEDEKLKKITPKAKSAKAASKPAKATVNVENDVDTTSDLLEASAEAEPTEAVVSEEEVKAEEASVEEPASEEADKKESAE